MSEFKSFDIIYIDIELSVARLDNSKKTSLYLYALHSGSHLHLQPLDQWNQSTRLEVEVLEAEACRHHLTSTNGWKL